MMPSQFTLDHRLSEIRPSKAELRIARELWEAAGTPSGPARSIGETVRSWLGVGRAPSRLSSLAPR